MSELSDLFLKRLCSWCDWSCLLPEQSPLHTEPRSLDPPRPGTLRVLSALHLSSPGPARKSHLCRVKNPLWKNVHGCAVLCYLCVVFKFPSGGEARWTVKSSSGKDVLSPGHTASPSQSREDTDAGLRSPGTVYSCSNPGPRWLTESPFPLSCDHCESPVL